MKNSQYQKNIVAIGDSHAEWGKLASFILYHRPDIVFVAGDFGWWPGFTAPDTAFPERLFGGVELHFVDGNHENHADLVRLAPRGKFDVVRIAERLWYHPRGSLWTMPDGRTVFAAGGARSGDRRHRKEGRDVFCRLEELKRSDLPADIPRADIVISHTQPLRFLVDEDHGPDASQGVLDEVLDAVAPSLWISGHQHARIDGNHSVTGTEWHVLDMLDSGCQGLSEDSLYWLSGRSQADDAVPGWGLPGGDVLPVRGFSGYRYAVMEDLPADLFSVFDKRRKYYRRRRDGNVKGVTPESVDCFFETLCTVGWDLEKAASRRERV